MRPLVSILFVLGGWAALAQGPTFDYPADPEFVILEYSTGHAMWVERDATPRLRLHGDGRVAVHYPDFTRRAGDWELHLTRGEVRSLLARLEGHGVFGFDAAEAKGRREAAEAARRAQEGTAFTTSDDTRMGLVVNLRSYTPSAGGPSVTDLRREVRWRNVQVDARRHPDVAAIHGLAAAERAVRELLERDDLERVPRRGSSLEIRE